MKNAVAVGVERSGCEEVQHDVKKEESRRKGRGKR